MERDKLKKEVIKKPTGIFYLEANRGFFYDQTLPSPIALDIPQDIISDLEIVGKKKLDTAIQSFIGIYKLVPKSIIILLSPAITFDKDFPEGSVQLDSNIQEFLDLVPFQEFISRQTKFPGKIKIVAANRELSDAIKDSFSSAGFSVSSIIPLSFCLEVLPQLQTNLDLGLVLEKAGELRGYSLTSEEIIPQGIKDTEKKQKDTKNLYMMIVVLGIVFVVLLIVVYKFALTPPKKVPYLPDTNTAQPVPTVFQKEATSSAGVNSLLDSSTQSSSLIKSPKAN